MVVGEGGGGRKRCGGGDRRAAMSCGERYGFLFLGIECEVM